MSATDSNDNLERDYFAAIEETFVRLRGTPFLLSPADYQLAKDWYRRRIPISLVLSTLEEVFARRRARGTAVRIQSLGYCAEAVERAWQEQVQLAAVDRRAPTHAIDVAGRLEALAAALPADLPGRAELTAEMRRLSGGAEEVEEALAAIDERLMTGLEAGLAAADSEELAMAADRALKDLRHRLDPRDRADARSRLRRQALRRRLGLPVLSLFAPEARSSRDH